MHMVGTQAKMTPPVQFGFSRWYQAANDNYLNNGAGLPPKFQHVDQARQAAMSSSTMGRGTTQSKPMISHGASENLKFQNADSGKRLSYLA